MHGLQRLPIVLLILGLAGIGHFAQATAPAATADSVSGFLMRESGSPVEGRVEYRSFADSGLVGSVDVGRDGSFRIEDVELGHYELTGRAKEAEWGVARAVVHAGAEEVVLFVTPAVSVRGKVRKSLAKKALGIEPSVRIIGQPLDPMSVELRPLQLPTVPLNSGGWPRLHALSTRRPTPVGRAGRHSWKTRSPLSEPQSFR